MQSFFSWNCLRDSICFTRLKIPGLAVTNYNVIVLLASNVSNSTFATTRCTTDSDWGTSTATYLTNENWAYACAISLNDRLKVGTRTKHWPGRAWKRQEGKTCPSLQSHFSMHLLNFCSCSTLKWPSRVKENSTKESRLMKKMALVVDLFLTCPVVLSMQTAILSSCNTYQAYQDTSVLWYIFLVRNKSLKSPSACTFPSAFGSWRDSFGYSFLLVVAICSQCVVLLSECFTSQVRSP